MTDEWVERRVADLEVGDDVKDYGIARRVEHHGDTHARRGRQIDFRGCGWITWPAHARVDIRRPAEVTVRKASSLSTERTVVFIGNTLVVNMPCEAHAEEYADRLRSSAHDRAAALGKDTT